MKFRAVTMHLPHSDAYPSYSDLLLKVSERLGSLSYRVVLREPSDEVNLDLKAVHAGTGPSAFKRAWELLERGYFTSVSLNHDCSSAELYRTAEFLFSISQDLGPEYATMFGLSIGEVPESPYFPITRAESFGLSFSLLYPSDLYGPLTEAEEPSSVLSHALSIIYREAHSMVEETLSDFNEDLPFLGIDFSLSPWMEESVAEVISLLARTPFMGPGTAAAVSELNRKIDEASDGMRKIGFNEVMLPMAEDDLLKEAASSLEFRARDLAMLTPYCLAGLDMVVLPISIRRSELAKLIADLIASSCVKGRALGLRVILADAEPGEEIELKRFGKVPVMML